jgi:hypothetical protein
MKAVEVIGLIPNKLTLPKNITISFTKNFFMLFPLIRNSKIASKPKDG